MFISLSTLFFPRQDVFVQLCQTVTKSGLTEQVVVGVPLILEGQSPIADVVQILQPLEIRHGHTAGVQVHVLQGATKHTQDSLSLCAWTVCVRVCAPTGITMTLFSRKILSASGVVGPLAPSAMI